MPLSWNEIKQNAIQFSNDWGNEQRENAEAQTFWNEFFKVFGLRRRTVATFEEKVRNIKGQFSFIDLFWRGKLLAEHKSKGKDLDKASTQAFEYIQCLKDENRDDEIPRYVVVSDFAKIVLHDLEPEENDPPVLEFPLSEFHKYIHAFAFIPGYKVHRLDKEDPANIEAAERMGRVHDTLFANGYSGHWLERFLVRTLFCLFAEDTGIFESNAFATYIEQSTREDGDDLGMRLTSFFEVLDTPKEKRQQNLDELLMNLPYVNGGLFEETLRAPACNRSIRDAMVAATRFDWSRISPAIFGSLFQSVMNPDERRKIGAHYTTEQNIMKVIRPLFLDDLRAEFEKVKSNKGRLREFHQKLRTLTFFDPACGCGNFLVLAYREMRLLEIDVLGAIHRKDTFDPGLFFHVDVDQFYGIEIVEFPVRIAETALWLMDHQMNIITSERFGRLFTRIPLQKSPTIVHDNALRIDWNDVLPKEKCSYILGNPPYVGKHYRSHEQREDIKIVLQEYKNIGDLDYVVAWFYKASEYIQGTSIPVAFVATNSITQGEQVSLIWSLLYEKYKVKIHFAYRTFVWSSEASGKAHVHVVIIGFGTSNPLERTLFDYKIVQGQEVIVIDKVPNISPYLTAASDAVVMKRRKPLGNVPAIRCGSKPTDDGNFIFTNDERRVFLKEEPNAKSLFRRFTGSQEFINGNMRWCLWLKDCLPEELKALPKVMERIKKVQAFRKASTAIPTQKSARSPALFFYDSQPKKNYILIPETSSELRDYIPIGLLSHKIIASNATFLVPSQDLFLFGVLTSTMHMDWMRQICGRLESRYRYSGSLVYNTFPWPENVTEKQRTKVEEKAQAVLDTREKFKDSTLADLYDPVTMPQELAKAHTELDRAVERAYRKESFKNDGERIAFLFALYEKLVSHELKL